MPIKPYAMLRDWTGVVDISTESLTEATPPAKLEYLIQACWYPLQVGMTYAQPALMYMGNDATASSGTTMDIRRIAVMVPPGSINARLWVTRCGSTTPSNGAQQGATMIETTSSGGIPSAAADVITVTPYTYGAEAYLSMAATPRAATIIQTAGTVDAAPAATKDRQIEFPAPAALAPAVEQIEIELSAGCGVLVTTRQADLETL